MLITEETAMREDQRCSNRKHYVAIKSLSRLLTKKNTKHKGTQHHCMNCLHGFPSEVSRDEHERYCRNNEAVSIEMPTRKPFIKYSHGQYQLKVPFLLYADFESILEPLGAPHMAVEPIDGD